MPRITLSHAVAGIGAGLALAVAVPLAASAHVTIDPKQADAGGWTYLTFRAPNESDTASTVSIDIHLPTDTPFTYAGYEPVPGWTGTVTTSTLPQPVEASGNTITEAPTEVLFQADPGAGIAPGQFQFFRLSLGPVPDVGSIVIPVTQTYSDGTVVEWAATPEQVAADDTLEPAPVLYVGDAQPAADHHAATTTTVEETTTTSDDGTGGVALGLSIAALVVAAGGALLAALALGRRRASA
jgi:uncharacterized protein YcnI